MLYRKTASCKNGRVHFPHPSPFEEKLRFGLEIWGLLEKNLKDVLWDGSG